MSKVTLIVNGVTYTGWVAAGVTRSIESISGQFSLEMSPFIGKTFAGDRIPNPAWQSFLAQPPIQMEDECTVQLDDDIVLTGAVDMIHQKLTANGSSIVVAGRDRASVLVDCTPELKQLQFNGIGVLEFCQMIGDPFGITFQLQDGVSDAAISSTPQTGTKAKFGQASSIGSTGKSAMATKIGKLKSTLTIEPGETAFSLIDRACRMVGLLPISDGLGNVLLTRSSADRCTAAIVEGRNLLDLEMNLDASKRFARYVVIGQNQPIASGEQDEDEPTSFSWVASTPDHGHDTGVRRTERVLIRTADGAVTTDIANMRADWEATVRSARAMALDLGVQGWRQGNDTTSKLWLLNGLVKVTSPSARVDDDMLISTVAFSQSVEQGTRTLLSVTRPEAFIPEPTIAGGKTLAHWWPAAGVTR